LTAEHGANNGATNIFENLFRQHETDIITNLIFEILSCILSCFLGFSANSFLRFHFVFQKEFFSEHFRTVQLGILLKMCKHFSDNSSQVVLKQLNNSAKN
jgi:hypothetical protein